MLFYRNKDAVERMREFSATNYYELSAQYRGCQIGHGVERRAVGEDDAPLK